MKSLAELQKESSEINLQIRKLLLNSNSFDEGIADKINRNQYYYYPARKTCQYTKRDQGKVPGIYRVVEVLALMNQLR